MDGSCQESGIRLVPRHIDVQKLAQSVCSSGFSVDDVLHGGGVAWTEVIRLAEGTGFSDQLLPLRRRERQRVGQGRGIDQRVRDQCFLVTLQLHLGLQPALHLLDRGVGVCDGPGQRLQTVEDLRHSGVKAVMINGYHLGKRAAPPSREAGGRGDVQVNVGVHKEALGLLDHQDMKLGKHEKEDRRH